MRSARALSSVGSLAMVLGLCATTLTTSAQAAEPTPTPSAGDRSGARAADLAEDRLRADATARVTVRTGGDGVAEFVGTGGAPVDGPGLPESTTPLQAASAHLDRYGALFGVDDPDADVFASDITGAPGRSTVVKFTQTVDGLPVVGGELAVSLDADGDLESVNGETTDGVIAVPEPSESALTAVRTAVRTTARTHGVRPATLVAGPAQEWYFDPELIGSPDPLGPRPVWRVEVRNGTDIDQLVLVDTRTGHVAAHVNQVAHAKDRVACDRARANQSDAPCVRGDYVLEEADAAGLPPLPRDDVDRVFMFAGDTWDLFRTLGRDLTTMIGHNAGDGKKLRLTANLRGQNAFWNGREAFFSTNFAADDVVGHELTHGVIEKTSNLMYWYQSGAINESMADVFGEIVDQRNDDPGQTRDDWLLGEDVRGGALRDMRRPTRVVRPGPPRQPDRMRSPFYFADRNLVDNGGVHINSGVGNKAAFLIAQGGTFNGRTVRGLDEGDPRRPQLARLYMRALTMLTSGSDYADLGRVLPEACRALVGTGRGSARFRANDCVQVRRAVLATEMLRQPRRATAPEAPRCTPRNARSRRVFLDNMERPRPRAWSIGRLWSRSPGPRVGLPPYATSGRRSLFGRNPDPAIQGPRRGSLTLNRTVHVRRGPRTFVRFDHARLFEFNFRSGPNAVYFDGGKVEYSLDRGRTWRNAAGLPWVNGPRDRIRAGRGAADDFQGFGGDSHGYVSSRLDLSRFAGRGVRLRWTVAGDASVGFLGWWLDDVEVYTCRR